jgi:hypothetical protein
MLGLHAAWPTSSAPATDARAVQSVAAPDSHRSRLVLLRRVTAPEAEEAKPAEEGAEAAVEAPVEAAPEEPPKEEEKVRQRLLISSCQRLRHSSSINSRAFSWGAASDWRSVAALPGREPRAAAGSRPERAQNAALRLAGASERGVQSSGGAGWRRWRNGCAWPRHAVPTAGPVRRISHRRSSDASIDSSSSYAHGQAPTRAWAAQTSTATLLPAA